MRIGSRSGPLDDRGVSWFTAMAETNRRLSELEPEAISSPVKHAALITLSRQAWLLEEKVAKRNPVVSYLNFPAPSRTHHHFTKCLVRSTCTLFQTTLFDYSVTMSAHQHNEEDGDWNNGLCSHVCGGDCGTCVCVWN